MSTRENAISIFNAAVSSVHPRHLIPAQVYVSDGYLHILNQRFPLEGLPNIYVIGAGKASAAMAESLEEVLGSRITNGLVVTKYHHQRPLKFIRCIEAAHPVPDEAGLQATVETLELLKHVTKKDIVICLLSGGASSLWADLPRGINLPQLQQAFDLLLKSGATIAEVNAVRKHLSLLKGGQLLRFVPGGTRWFSLMISDVPGDMPGTIASGPTVADESSFADVHHILEKYGLTTLLPVSILQHISAGMKGLVPETLKLGDPVFTTVWNQVIGSNAIALETAEVTARQFGYTIPFVDDELNGDAATVGREFTRTCKKYSGPKPACFLLGGETTVVVKGPGKGGRNQHMALSALHEMTVNDEREFNNTITFLAAGTDGTDGPTDAAGAIADKAVLAKMQESQLDPKTYLQKNDAYSFFDLTDGLLISGPTQTNVMDLVIVIVE